MKSEVTVSVICNVYNQEKYIKDCLNGFLIQECDFKVEYLIHDDASTDGTKDIILDYINQYPGFFTVVFENENQYSQGVSITELQCERAKGKYIAFCEGDDYWTDPNKLKKQVQFMEKNENIMMCAHAARMIDDRNGQLVKVISPLNSSGILSVEDVIKGDGGYVATNSLFWRKDLFTNLPKFHTIYPIDYSLQILGAIPNGIYFMVDVMSTYRFMAQNSWSASAYSSPKKKLKIHKSIVKMLNQLDIDTNGKYQHIIRHKIVIRRVKLGVRLILSLVRRFF